MQIFKLKVPEPPEPIFIDKSTPFPWRSKLDSCPNGDWGKVFIGQDGHIHWHRGGIFPGTEEVIFPCGKEDCDVCSKSDSLYLANFWFPFVFRVESQIFVTFKKSFPFFYEFFQYRIESDPRIWQRGYYFIISLGLLLIWFMLYKVFYLFKFIKREHAKRYYTRK